MLQRFPNLDNFNCDYLNYDSIEAYPVSKDDVDKMRYCDMVGEEYKLYFDKMTRCPWGKKESLKHGMTLLKIQEKIQDYTLEKGKYDLIYVKCGELISENLILELKKKTKKIIYFYNDNPFVKRDKKRWKLFLPASKHYDLLIFQDQSRLKYLKKWKIKKGHTCCSIYAKLIILIV